MHLSMYIYIYICNYIVSVWKLGIPPKSQFELWKRWETVGTRNAYGCPIFHNSSGKTTAPSPVGKAKMASAGKTSGNHYGHHQFYKFSSSQILWKVPIIQFGSSHGIFEAIECSEDVIFGEASLEAAERSHSHSTHWPCSWFLNMNECIYTYINTHHITS